MKAIYSRTRISGAEDVAVTTHDFVHSSSDWSDTECNNIAFAFQDFWNALCANYIWSGCKLIELRFYKGYNGDGSPGEVDLVKTYTLPGAHPTSTPPQVSCSVTEITDSRRHWGRFYIPGIATVALQSDGTLTSAAVTAIANAAETMYEAWGALAGTVTPVVWARSGTMSYSAAGAPRWRPTWVYGATGGEMSPPEAVSVQAIRVDEILDIQRPRRYQSTQNRQTRQLA